MKSREDHCLPSLAGHELEDALQKFSILKTRIPAQGLDLHLTNRSGVLGWRGTVGETLVKDKDISLISSANA